MLTKLCPRCHKVIPARMAYSEKCQQQVEQQRQKDTAAQQRRYNQTRDRKLVQFYHSQAWMELSHIKMAQENYLCEECKKAGRYVPAQEVHHRVPVREDWDRRLDITNLECLCTSCHNKKHKKFFKKGGGGQKKWPSQG